MHTGGQRRGGIIEGINVTPLVDITLVLLIIFMVTAKLMVTPAVPLDLPEASKPEEVQSVLTVFMPAEGPMLVDGLATGEQALADRVRQLLTEDPAVRAVIQADGAVPHRRVMAVLDALKVAGLRRVAFGASPLEEDGASR